MTDAITPPHLGRTGDQSTMIAVPVPSSPGYTASTVYWHHGKVVGCSCRSRTYNPSQACKHRQDKQAEIDQSSCLYCGRRTGGALMCGRCAW
jgi:hypothetical protein